MSSCSIVTSDSDVTLQAANPKLEEQGAARTLLRFYTKCVILLYLGYSTCSLLICTLNSEIQGLEKSRSISNLGKISGPAQLEFFSVCHLDFFQIYVWYKSSFFSTWRLDWKKIQFCRTWNPFKVYSRPWFFKSLIFKNQGAD